MASFPVWEELPELDLYLDQVLLYVNQVTSKAFENQEKPLTAAMVNNYVKHAHIPKPIKKKYNRIQVARLIVLTTLKPVFPIQDIVAAVQQLVESGTSQTYYDEFVTGMKEDQNTGVHPMIQSACQTIKVYHQTKRLAHDLEGGKVNGANPIPQIQIQ